jgi:hypothetical protein
VLVGLLDSDPSSWRTVDPGWQAAYPELAALLQFGATER